MCTAGAKLRSQASRGKRRWQSFGGARGEALSAALGDQSGLDKGKGIAQVPSSSGKLKTSARTNAEHDSIEESFVVRAEI